MIKTEEIPLHSLKLQSAAYDEQTRALQIRFKNGQIYTYHHVPAVLFTMLVSSSSADRRYRRYIQGKYPVSKKSLPL